MPPSFNLLDEPFIPAYTSAGRRACSLREALLAAHEVREVRAASPLVTAALHRLLLAVLHRNFGPASVTQWRRLWDGGSFPAGPLEEYFSRWHGRFDLFDKDRPFFQDPAFRAKSPAGINQLVRELSRGNNATLFDHTFEEPPPSLPPAEVARALVAEQAFAVGGGKSEQGYTTSAPLVGGVVVLVRGESLFETLLLNLVRYRYDGEEEQPVPGGEGDRPAWERDGRPGEGGPAPDGYLDYLTWQSRSIHLYPEPDGHVRSMSFAQGRKFAPEKGLYDPMVAYKRDPESGDRPVRLTERKALWRESAALFQFAEAGAFRPPANLRWVAELRAVGALPRDRRFTLWAVGLCTDKAKVNFWRHEALPLPPDYLNLTDATLANSLKSAIDLAEEVGAAVRGAAATLAARLLAPGERTPDKGQVWAVVDSLAADEVYWSRLELPFRQFLTGLPGPSDHQKGRVDAWFRETLRRTARAAFDVTAGQLDHSARALRALIAGRQQLNGSLAKVAKRHHIETAAKEGAHA
jgi:CRISPR system Cascade subunit CasA